MKPSGNKNFYVNALIFVGVLIVAFLIAEKYYSLKVENMRKFAETFGCGQKSSSETGGSFEPDCSTAWIKTKGTEQIFNVEFHSDKFGRRSVPGEYPAADKNVIFFGGSDVLGAGVNDNETIPFYFSQLSPGSQVYNYAAQAYGPQHLLQLLEKGFLHSEIRTDYNKNTLVFFFADEHIVRAAGSWRIAAYYGYKFPYYALDSKGNLISKGDFESGGRFPAFMYQLKKSLILEDLVYSISEYFEISAEDVRLTAKILESVKTQFESQFKNSKFLVVFSARTSPKVKTQILPYLEGTKTASLDYSTLMDPEEKANRLLHDSHPNAKAYKSYAEQLAKDLER